jgi:hypothetical protein
VTGQLSLPSAARRCDAASNVTPVMTGADAFAGGGCGGGLGTGLGGGLLVAGESPALPPEPDPHAASSSASSGPIT